MVLTIVTFILNKKGHMAIARHFLLLTTAAFVYLFSSSEPIETGSFLNFIPLIVGAFILIGHRKRRYAIIYTVIIVGLFSLATLTDYSILPIRQYDESNIKYFLISNFLISSTATIFIVLFVNRLNHNIETRLRNNERNLNKLAGELELSRQRFELAIAGSNAGIYDWDIKHNIIYHSPIWKEMLGYEDKNFQDIPIEQFYDMLHPEDRPRVKKAVEAHLKGNKKYREELRLKHAKGNYVWFIDSGQAHWDHNGNPVRMVGSLINIDERKKAMDRIKKQNEMLEKTNSELDKFVYSTSHDLRAPLMSILGLINIAENSKDEDELRECLRLMAGRVNKLDEFINEIIDFSKNSRTEVAREQFMLDPVVRSVINELQYIENSDKIKFQYEFDPEFLLESDKQLF
jgi:PAS domain S-box-containing protein